MSCKPSKSEPVQFARHEQVAIRKRLSTATALARFLAAAIERPVRQTVKSTGDHVFAVDHDRRQWLHALGADRTCVSRAICPITSIKPHKIEYPDVETASLEEVNQAIAPMTVIDPDFQNYEEICLEDAVSYALQNGKVFRGYGTPSLQGTRVSPGQDNLANGPNAAGTIYNVAIRETEPGFIGTPGQISNPGSISTNTGLDVNQGVEAASGRFRCPVNRWHQLEPNR